MMQLSDKNSHPYHELLDSLPEAVVVFSKDLQVATYNQEFLKLCGYEKAELSPLNFKSLFDTENLDLLNLTGPSQENGKMKEHYDKAELLCKNTILPVRISFKLQDNYIVVIVIPLNQLIIFDKMHMDFISTVSHELRTPLTSIRGFADTLLASGDKLTKEQYNRFITIIKDQTERLSRLVENILQVSRLESKKYSITARSLNTQEYVNKVIQAVSAKDHGNHKISLKVEPNIKEVWADPDKFEQILINLIDNAVKYSPKKSEVIVSVSNRDDCIEIKVQDQGCGIPENKIADIFRKFSRLHNPLTQDVDGTGLGLYITKSLVEILNGTISLRSKIDEGSVFTIILPSANAVLKGKSLV